MNAIIPSKTTTTGSLTVHLNACFKSILIAAALSASAVHGHAQILQYNFEGNATNSGTGGSNYNFTTTPASATYTTGVGGLGQALDLSANTVVGGVATTFGGGSAAFILPAQTALTMAGWLRVDQAFTATQSVILRNSSTNAGLILGSASVASDVGRLGLQVGNGTANTTIRSNANSFGTSSQIGEWVFFAVSWDLVSGSYAWYSGTETTAASLINSGTSAISTMATTAVPNTNLGRSNSASGAYSGDMDSISLFGTALNSTQVEALRASAIPEPSTWALLAASLTIVVVLRRRRS